MDGHELASLLICRGAQICVLNVNNQFCSDHRFCPTLSCAQLRVTAVLYPRDGVYAHVATCQANDGRNVSTDHGTFHIALDVHEAPDGIETGELRSTSAYNIATSIPARLEFERTPRVVSTPEAQELPILDRFSSFTRQVHTMYLEYIRTRVVQVRS